MKKLGKYPKNFIKELREKRDWTQRELAERAGFAHHQTINNLENSIAALTHSHILKLAATLGCQPLDIIQDPANKKMVDQSADKGNECGDAPKTRCDGIVTDSKSMDVRIHFPKRNAGDMTFHDIRGIYCEFDNGSAIRLGRISKEIKPASCENTPMPADQDTPAPEAGITAIKLTPTSEAMKNYIKEIRNARGMSQETLADLAKTTHQQIHFLETGKRKLTYEWIIRLADALGVPRVDITEGPEACMSASGQTDTMQLDGIENKIDSIFNKRLRDVLQKDGKTQAWLAEQINVKPGYLSELLNGHPEKRWNMDLINSVCQVLQIQAWVLFIDQ